MSTFRTGPRQFANAVLRHIYSVYYAKTKQFIELISKLTKDKMKRAKIDADF